MYYIRKATRKFGFCNKIFYVMLCFLPILICKSSMATPYFAGSGLIDVPTAYIMNHGIFDAGTHVKVRRETRKDLSFKAEFGFLNFAELGFIKLEKADGDNYVRGKAKIILAREEGILPAFAVGVDNFGEDIESDISYYDMSFYGVISKQFNLPFIHIIGLHLGLGNKSYVYDESIGKYLHGFFAGLNKEWIIDSRDMRVSFIAEIKGKWANIGLRCLTNSGVGVNLAIGQFDFDRKDISYNIGLSFTNEPIMKQITQSMELAKQAVRIANEARSEYAGEKKTD